MPSLQKAPPQLIAALEGGFWIACVWAITWTVNTGTLAPAAVASLVATVAVTACFLYRPLSLRMGRFRVRASRTRMVMHLCLPPGLLAPVIWIAMEKLLTDMPTGFQKMDLSACLSTTGYLVFCLAALGQRFFRSDQQQGISL